MKRLGGPAMSPAPFAFKARTTSSLAWGTAAALVPAVAWGLFAFGPQAALPLICSIAAALAGEALVGALAGRFTLWDGTAFLTGLLVGMSMPPGVSPAVPAAASLFAVAVVKGAFGGLGSNWMNPALAGVAFALLNWPSEMGRWAQPLLVDGYSGATPLASARAALHVPGSLDFLAAGGALLSGVDGAVTDALNRGIFAKLGADLPSGYVDLLLGNKGGAIGEVSGILLLASSIVLLARRMIRWEIPASIVASFSFAAWAFGGLAGGGGLFSGDVLFSLLTGSILLVAFFMAPDPVTSPSSRWGMIAYGAGVGLAAFALRSLGSAPEGCAFAVIIMNCAVPALSKLDLAAARRRIRAASPDAAPGARREDGNGGVANGR
jgi:Na+-translocating ferredoxin:NAD+ oxidoreductase subunit D